MADSDNDGFARGVADAKKQQSGELGSALNTDHDGNAREKDHKRVNAWIKGGGDRPMGGGD